LKERSGVLVAPDKDRKQQGGTNREKTDLRERESGKKLGTKGEEGEGLNSECGAKRGGLAFQANCSSE